jgi:hypothetical protein
LFAGVNDSGAFWFTIHLSTVILTEFINAIFAKKHKTSFLIIENKFLGFFSRENWVYKFGHWKGGGEQQCTNVTLPRKIAHKRSFKTKGVTKAPYALNEFNLALTQ